MKTQATIGDVFTWTKGKKPNDLFETEKENAIPYLSASYFRTNKPQFYADKNDKNCVNVNKRDVVLIWDGSNAGDVFNGLEGALSSTMVKFNESEKCDSSFLYFLLKNNFQNLNKQAVGSTIPHVNGNVLKNIQIPIENLNEQKSIARKLTAIQNAITGQEVLIKKLKDLKQSMMHQLFTYGTKGEKTKTTEIGEIPESWNLVKLGSVCEKPTYGFTDSASANGNVKFLRITDIKDDGVNWASVPFCNCPNPEKYLLKDGDIVFARIGATTGKSYLLKNPDNAVYASYLIRVRARDIQGGFLHKYFQSKAYWKQIDSQKGSSLKGGVNGSILSELLTPMCSTDEQDNINEAIDVIDHKINLTQRKLLNYQNLFNTLLHELMSEKEK